MSQLINHFNPPPPQSILSMSPFFLPGCFRRKTVMSTTPQGQKMKIKCFPNHMWLTDHWTGALWFCIFYFFSVTLPWSWFIRPNYAPKIIKTSLICNILIFSPTRSIVSCLLWLVDGSRCYTTWDQVLDIGSKLGIYVRSEPDLVLLWCCKSL